MCGARLRAQGVMRDAAGVGEVPDPEHHVEPAHVAYRWRSVTDELWEPAHEGLAPIDGPTRFVVDDPPVRKGPSGHERRVPLRLGTQPSSACWTGRSHEQPTMSNGIFIILLLPPRNSWQPPLRPSLLR